MKLRPYHVFFLCGLFAASPSYYYFSHKTQSAKEMIHDAKRVSGKVTTANHVPRNRILSVDVKIPSTLGVTQCHGFIFPDEYGIISANGGSVDVFVSLVYSPPLPLECWTVSQLNEKASQTIGDHLVDALRFGLLLGWICYLLVVRIPFGVPRQSLKSRWSDGAR